MFEPHSSIVSLRILLAEDNKINQQFALFFLNRAGHDVTIAENGHQAVDAVRDADFDVVLMDVQMPELDGVQATRQIRALSTHNKDIPIIAMTAHAMNGAREEYLAAGMNDYISKPFQPALVLEKLARIAGRGLAHSQATAPVAACAYHGSDIVDLDKMKSLEAVLPASKLDGFVLLCLKGVEGHLTEIATCAKADDFEGIAGQAHMLVSVAGNLGAMQTSALARDLERACVSRDREQLVLLRKNLNLSCAAMAHALGAWLQARSSPQAYADVG